MSRQACFLSGYRIMWILVMFNLPTDTKLRHKEAMVFRKFLLDDGLERCQFSAYTRFVSGKDALAARVKRIERNLLSLGDIQIPNLTDRQYRDVVHFSNCDRQGRLKNPEQLAFN